jgi:hypothetical protein
MENINLIRLSTQAKEAAPVTRSPDILAFRTGFLAGQVSVPPDFDTMGQTEIAALFGET